MDINNTFISDMFRIAYHLWQRFIYHYISFKELGKIYKNLPGDREFWVHTCDAHLEMATIYWCMVFGTDSNETHWKKLGLNNKEFEKMLFDFCDWQHTWNELTRFRNEYVAHRPKEFENIVPHFDNAYKAMLYLEAWVREQIKPDIIEGLPLSEIAEKNREKISETLEKLAP